MIAIGFIDAERRSQAAFFASTAPPELINEVSAYRLKPGQHLLNLAPAIQAAAAADFGAPRNIVWHRHTNHGLSSQVCCLDVLMPLATQPAILARWTEHTLGLDARRASRSLHPPGRLASLPRRGKPGCVGSGAGCALGAVGRVPASHPQGIVDRGYAGPARTSGSAGTGKTVVALHRAARLARASPDVKVLNPEAARWPCSEN